MAEQRENYKGREIILRTGAEASTARATAGIREDEAGAEGTELYIDGERIFTVRDAGGKYIASGFAFDPQPSPVDLARKIIDYRETGE
ncbi:tyrosinase family oxidase copper chaperone [Nitrosospira briensis]|uniref:tyrosinase family oxidase copper chaperone n=1 Tax=Nitrosospira briensis TaxID=35799 RepID=UPI000469FC26|nr:tyrosinase family oxidase copper chaperone [Nitrosospira briensis]